LERFRLMNIKELVKNNFCYFHSYRKSFFYYTLIIYTGTEGNDDTTDHYLFPIPVDDLGDATLLGTEKAIHLMRYIRKAIAENTLIKQ